MGIPTYLLLIEGRQCPAADGRTVTLYSPASGEPVAEVAVAGPAEVDRAVTAAYREFCTGPWRRMSPSQRGRVLQRAAELVRAHAEELARLETLCVGKPIREARADVERAAYCLEYYAGAATKVLGHVNPVSAPGISVTFREPIGVCALIVPWNFPIAIAAWKAAPALALGNAVILKPSVQAPLSTLRLGELLLEAGVPAGAVHVLTGPGSETGEALVRHPLVRKVSFTGSSETGSRIMALAAEGIKRVTLELGGKSANIVFADADLDTCLPASVWGALENAGQDCCARSRILVERPIYDEFVDALVELVEGIQLGDPFAETTEMGPLVSPQQRQRVLAYIEAGDREGAVRVTGGTVPSEGPLSRGCYLYPAVFRDVHPGMRIAQEEIFGPVIAVVPFDTEEEAVRIANATPYGLSGTIWTRDIGRAWRVARAVESGVLAINAGQTVHVEAPFGGFKQSGLGRELGMAALDHFCELKSVFVGLDSYLAEG